VVLAIQYPLVVRPDVVPLMLARARS